VRGAWIGWDFRHHYDRLHLIANNSRFLIPPEHHVPNLASRVLALSERRLVGDWRERFGYPLVLLETFVDPRPNASLSAPCTAKPKPACRVRYSAPNIVTEPRESC
jgi:hypothetical protein